jgi:hypothetical protein
MAPEIDHDAAPDDLPGERRARAARNQRRASGGREPNQLADIGIGFRQGHRERPLLILRRVGRIDRAGKGIEQQFAREAIAEAFEFGGNHRALLERIDWELQRRLVQRLDDGGAGQQCDRAPTKLDAAQGVE